MPFADLYVVFKDCELDAIGAWQSAIGNTQK
jgi:hypothetical protein